jgi:hypothetical protein
MIRSFAGRETEKLFNNESSRRLPGQIQRGGVAEIAGVASGAQPE